MLPASFINHLLHNRLGQAVELAVYHTFGFGREYVFVAALTHQLSSIVAKNAEHFAFQLREFFKLDARRFELIEMRGDGSNPEFWRWRFEWVGNSPLSPKCERVSSSNQLTQLLSLLQATPRAAIA
jgi:hypothetical protein